MFESMRHRNIRNFHIATFIKRPESFFLITALLFGLIMLVVIPPLQVQDENSHFYRAYQISDGQLFEKNTSTSSGGILPSSLVTFESLADGNLLSANLNLQFHPKIQYKQLWSVTLNSKKESIVNFPTLAKYPPVAYAPQAVGIFIARLFTNRILIMFYLGRLCNLFFFITLCYFAIRIIPRGKWPLAFIAVLPMTLATNVSLSADAPTLAFIALFVAMLVKILYSSEITNKDWLLLLLTSCCMSLSKQTYYIFSAAVLLLLLKKLPKKTYRKVLLMTGSILGANILLLSIVDLITKSINGSVVALQAAGGYLTSPRIQLTFLKTHPFSFLHILIRTLFSADGNNNITTFFGSFGWLNIPLPYWSMFLLVIIIFLSFGLPENIKEKSLKPLGKLASIVLLILAGLNILVIFIGLYVYWTPYRFPIINGFQGRYLIATLLFLLPCMIGRFSHNIKPLVLQLGTMIVLITSVAVMLFRFYTLSL